MKKLIFFLTFFFVIGPVPNTSMGVYLDTILLTSLFLIFFLNKKSKKTNTDINFIKRLVFVPLYYILFIGFPITFISDLTSTSLDFIRAIMRSIKIIITFFGALALVNIYIVNYPLNYFNKICKNILFVLLINGVIMISQLIPSVNNFITTLLYNNVSDIHFQSLFRVGGLYLSGGAMASVFQGFALLLIPYLFKLKEINFFQVIIYYIIIIISIFITGRTGLVIIPISLLCFLYYSSITSKSIIFTLVFILVYVSSILLDTLETYTQSLDNQMLNFNFNRFSRLFSSEDRTTTYLLKTFTIPQDISLLFGNLNFNNYEFRDVSDMGWNISLYKYGIFGILFYYSIVFFIFIKSFSRKHIDKSKAFLFRIFILTYLLIEFKEEVIYARNGLSILFLLTIIFLMQEKKITKISI